MLNNTISNKLFELFLHSSIFLILFEMASGYSFYTLELSLVMLIFSFAYIVVIDLRFKLSELIMIVNNRLSGSILTVIALLLYIIYDVITAIYTPDIMLVILKYKVILVMGFISLCLVYYANSKKRISNVLLNISCVSFFTSLLTFANYIILKIYPIYYTLRLTLRRDYNMFATTIFIGLITGFFCILNSYRPTIIKLLQILVLFTIEIPIILLSGSRRIYILIIPTIILMIVLFIINESIITKEALKIFTITLLWSICTVIICYFNTLNMNMYMLSVYQIEGNEGSSGIISSEETSTTERYETVSNGSLFDKRSIIWRVAVDEIKTFTPRELLIGKGNSYDILLYDIVESEELNQAYPDYEARKNKLSTHNFILADMINGGIIKVILGITLILGLIYTAISMLIIKPFQAVPYSLILGLIVINNLISNRYGLLYDKFFYIFFCLTILNFTCIKNRKYC